MTQIAWKLSLPTVPNPVTPELKKLANCIDNADHNSSNLFPALRGILANRDLPEPRYIDTIFDDILHENFESISALEWLSCLYKKYDWDEKHPDQAKETADLIWNAAQENNWLRQRLYWDLALYFDHQHYGGDRPSFPASLVSAWKSFSRKPETKRLDEKTSKILLLLANKELSKLAQRCLREYQLPDELLSTVCLPSRIQAVDKILQEIPKQFIDLQKHHQESVDLLIQCLEKLTDTLQIKSVEQLLVQGSPQIGSTYPRLINWLKINYGRSSSCWQKLSSDTKKSLIKWIGAVNYADFQKLVDRVIDKVNLSDQDVQRLRSRREFWSNYSDRFEGIRIVLPQATANILSESHDNADISIFREISDFDTEVCIFDFGDWYVVEFFRGLGSETRLYSRQNHPALEANLFQSGVNSPNCLRCMGGDFHDHHYLWQIDCEKWLRKKDIRPNEGITHFKRVDAFDSYDSEKGLKFPSMQQKDKREQQVAAARSKIQRIQDKAGQSCCKHRKIIALSSI